MDDALPRRQRTLDEIMGAAESVTKEVKVKGEKEAMEVVDVTYLAVSSELASQMVVAMMNVRQTMYPIRLFRNVESRELVVDHELLYGESLLDSVHLVLRDQPYNV